MSVDRRLERARSIGYSSWGVLLPFPWELDGVVLGLLGQFLAGGLSIAPPQASTG